jgi:hypothetical protein
MDPFHERLARITLDAAEWFGFALAGVSQPPSGSGPVPSARPHTVAIRGAAAQPLGCPARPDLLNLSLNTCSTTPDLENYMHQ